MNAIDLSWLGPGSHRRARTAVAIAHRWVGSREMVRLSATTHLPGPEAERLLIHDLQGLIAGGVGDRQWARRLLAVLLHPIAGTTWQLQNDPAGLARVRKLSGRYPLVFLPAHRSYADSPILGSALRDAGFAGTYRLAGDNLSFWPLSALGRRAGTIFIRRDFGRDPTYHLAVRAYLTQLLEQGVNLEWYPEAGRTRTGRLRRIRPGLLRILLDAFRDARIDDLYLVPVSITYDLLPEAQALVQEDRDGTKQPEGLSAIFRYYRRNRVARGGTARLIVGEPISLRHQLLSAAGAGDWAVVETITRELAHRLDAATPLTVESALTLVLAEGERGPQNVGQINRALEPLLAFAADRGIPVTGLNRLHGPRGVQTVLDRLVRAGVVTAVEGQFQPSYRIGPDQHQLAAFYRYSGSHWLIMRAIAELALMSAADCGDPIVPAMRLRGLLAHVFVLPQPAQYTEALRGEVADLLRRGRPEDPSSASLVTQSFLLAPRLLGPVLEAFHRVAVWLRDAPGPLRDRRRWSCLEVFADTSEAPVRWPESLSRELCRAGLAAAAQEGLLQSTPAAAAARAEYADELAEFVDQLAHLVRFDTVPGLLRGLDERL
ncbi:1-acyl-sn-glycerol-3-phosphate acyltransferase [Nocardia sp. NPDC088792]|uniref:1-acyl-sn-glycerol-3-phosphate acyltransferase n=1 Tax=Nocardia sp. NPDC088792 TaxID=3364332 RepID=UPI0038072C70